MQLSKRLAVFALLASLAACSGGAGTLPDTSGASTHSRNIVLPADSAESLPGDSAESLPGDSAESLPGAQLACNVTFEVNQANCTVAINLAIPPNSDITTPSNLLPGLHPADLRSAYSLPSGGSGRTVAIVDAYDDPNAEVDLAVYRAAYGLPACTSLNGCFTKVNQRGGRLAYPALNLGWSTEISLDLDVVSAVCPDCSILLVEADSASIDNLGAAVDTAAAMGAKYISNSYYGVEWPGETAEDAHYHHPGTAITVSSGDQRSTFYPAASPYVTSVGGTTLSNGSESAWPYGGDGCSLYESKPEWQGNTGCHMRATVDVAAVADPQTGVSMYDSTAGGWLVAGGTSVGAPLVAAAYALSGNPQGPAYSYARRASFKDVLPAGYDLPTGLGSPNGVGGL